MKTGATLIAMALLVGCGLHGTAQAKPDTSAVYFVGDSITFGSGLPKGERRATRYPAQARDLLGLPHARVLGLGGRCLVATGCVGTPLVQNFEEEVLNARPTPSLVVLEIGVNDLAHASDHQLRAAYRTVVRAGRDRGIKVMVGTITPTARTMAIFPREWIEPQRQRINVWIRQRFPRKVIDFAAALEGEHLAMQPKFDSGDGLHPNALGAERLAETAAARMSR